MRNGVFGYPAIERVVFGRPCAETLAEEAVRIGAERVFFIASGTLFANTDLPGRLKAALGSRFAGVAGPIRAHTPRDDVVAAANAARAAGSDLLATVGGGSVTDAGKMAALCLANGITEPGQLDGYYTRIGPDGNRDIPKIAAPKVRQIAVPTTLSGGEFNANAGAIDTARNLKQSFVHREMVPRVVVLDPAVTVHTPEWLFLSTGIRAVDHAVEDVCSINPQPYVDGTATHALRLLSTGLRRCRADPQDLEARLDCQIGVWLSTTGSAAGVQKGASHAIGHMLGGTAKVPHGHTSCVMLPSVLRWNRPVNAERQAMVSEALGRPGMDAADAVAELIADLGQPGRLREVGVGEDQLDTIAEVTMTDRWTHTNPRKITSPAQVREILDMAW